MIGNKLEGTVVKVDTETTYVYIHKKGGGGCAGCAASGGCSAVGCVEEVPTVENVQEGETVRLHGTSGTRKNRGILFYAGAVALFVVGFTLGETAAPYLSAFPGLPGQGENGFSIFAGIATVLLVYGPVYLRSFLQKRRGDSLTIVPR